MDTVPRNLPIAYDEGLLRQWHGLIRPGPLNVGLCWAGNPESRYDEHRTIPLETLAPLIDLAETRPVRFFGLQQGLRESDEAAATDLPIRHIGHMFHDYRNTAHAMKCLDLVVTVDTSVAHMAGTVGVPTWILVTRFRTYWLWLKGRDDTPWYPSVKLIRQPVHGSWPSTVGIVRENLLGLLAAE